MTVIKNDVTKGYVAYPYPETAGACVATRVSTALLVAPAVGDIAAIGILPSGCRIIDFVVDADSLDSGSAKTLAGSVGLLTGTPDGSDTGRDMETVLFDVSTVVQSGGIKRPDTPAAFRVAPQQRDRLIGVKFSAAAATFKVGEIGITVTYATA